MCLLPAFKDIYSYCAGAFSMRERSFPSGSKHINWRTKWRLYYPLEAGRKKRAQAASGGLPGGLGPALHLQRWQDSCYTVTHRVPW